ncbi:hypothetical protein HYU19_00340 [Candidatus Woesearchaeota archaeon]|nr:hypothetical protein [Candidatus Woesearchaeota archaeon]
MALYLVKTEAGTTMLSQRQQAYVRSPLGGYVRKEPEFLAEGDIVIFEKEHAAIALDTIDEALERRDDRYARAKDLLFEKNSQGVYVPRLRTNLLRGLAFGSAAEELGSPVGTLGGVPEDHLEEKILKEGQRDVSVAAYRASADLVHGRVAEYAQTIRKEGVSWDTVLNWLRGNVVAPQNKQLLYALSPIHDQLGAWAASFHGNGEIAQAYHVYTGIRQSVMAYLAEPANKGLGTGSGEERRKRAFPEQLCIEGEIAIILEEFGGLVRQGFFETTVHGVEQLTGNSGREAFSRKKNDPSLAKGVYTDKAPESISVHDLDEIVHAYSKLLAPMLYYGPPAADDPSGEEEHPSQRTAFPAHQDVIRLTKETLHSLDMPLTTRPADIIDVIKRDAVKFGYDPRQVFENIKKRTEMELEATHRSFAANAEASMLEEYERTIAPALKQVGNAPSTERAFAKQQRKLLQARGRSMISRMKADAQQKLMGAKQSLHDVLREVFIGINEGQR